MHDPNSPEGQLAKVIWEASRADEGTISATGADHVASAIVAALERGELKLSGPGQPSCPQCGGAYPRDAWPGNQYDGHWDTCPNRPCGAKAVGGYCIMPRGHNMGRADVRDNHMARQGRPKPETWEVKPGPMLMVPEPEPLIDYDRLQRAITDGVAEALIWNDRRRS